MFTDLCLIKKFKVFKLNKKPYTNIVFNPYNYTSELKKLKIENLINYKKSKKFNLIADSGFKNFIPNKIIKKKINKLKLPNNFIGIHLRSTDRAINIKNFLTKIQFKEMIFNFQIDHMINNLINFINSKSRVKNIFISSDNKFYKQKALKKLNDKINIYSNKSIYKTENFRQTNGHDFITELFCLSKSKMIISTVGGAVPRSASLIAKNKIKIYKWTNITSLFIIFKIMIITIFYLKRLKKILIN